MIRDVNDTFNLYHNFRDPFESDTELTEYEKNRSALRLMEIYCLTESIEIVANELNAISAALYELPK